MTFLLEKNKFLDKDCSQLAKNVNDLATFSTVDAITSHAIMNYNKGVEICIKQ